MQWLAERGQLWNWEFVEANAKRTVVEMVQCLLLSCMEWLRSIGHAKCLSYRLRYFGLVLTASSFWSNNIVGTHAHQQEERPHIHHNSVQPTRHFILFPVAPQQAATSGAAIITHLLSQNQCSQTHI